MEKNNTALQKSISTLTEDANYKNQEQQYQQLHQPGEQGMQDMTQRENRCRQKRSKTLISQRERQIRGTGVQVPLIHWEGVIYFTDLEDGAYPCPIGHLVFRVSDPQITVHI
ncbi:hypothetical protein GDO78_022843 [Eleutherodactylus coqui]|uniref:Uncharacterized protein n=1 Tax=Eleutherodactylus coqui TaxID=57060 RepID=A0A8J6EG78_ELECQ|nr:hypothetical protein GDO78_022843 [Eleutherodactylus coqui]